jgi:hypothetical protein
MSSLVTNYYESTLCVTFFELFLLNIRFLKILFSNFTVLGCDFFELMANLQIYGRTFANKFFRLRLMYFLFVRCGFFGKG